MVVGRITVLVGLAGCRQIFGLADPQLRDGGGVDVAADTIDSPGPCFGSGIEQVCLTVPPNGALVIAGPMTIDTEGMCDPTFSTTTPACVRVGSSITISSQLRVLGARPLVLVATDQIVIDGEIDVASYRLGGSGASADATPCDKATDATLDSGGAGGSFGGKGGNGARGASGGSGGNAGAAMAATSVRGGCPGSIGSGQNPGAGGHGGGAVYLIAVNKIDIAGTINASGAGGGGGLASSSGGGGGGSGGLIGLDAAVVAVAATGKVFANGGGGGEGAGTGNDGMSGSESPQPGQAGIGGSGGNSNAGDGGRGGYSISKDGANGYAGVSSAGGGAGGGSVGVIKVYGAFSSIPGTVSPAP